jgi:hypothetical protein
MTRHLIKITTGVLFLNIVSFAVAASSSATRSQEDIDKIVKFLVSEKIFTMNKNDNKVPLSYYLGDHSDIEKYFGKYICEKANTCAVVDSLYKDPYAILGRGLPPQQGLEEDRLQAQAQIERTNMKYGANIYDAATWQIAIALAAKNGKLKTSIASTLVNNQLEQVTHAKNRATDKSFLYGYKKPITDAKKAFTFRMVARDFHNKDPFYNTEYQNQLHWDYDPNELAKTDPEKHKPDFFKYISTWSDWKPIIGENAWAQLIGPLQAELLLKGDKIVPDSKALQNAMNTLDAFAAMQAGIGAFYYAPGGSQGNEGPIEQGEISLENNFSMLGGLQILHKILQNTEQTKEVQAALQKIKIMLHGGMTPNGYTTIGLLSFIYNGAYDEKNGIFYTHGRAKDPASKNDWEPSQSDNGADMAVDINTWGTSALGVETIDKWYGEGTALKIWQNVRKKGGYFKNGELRGVGYTLKNSTDAIMSTEWTAGAVNMVQSLVNYYEPLGKDVSALENDLKTMENGIEMLRNDNYLAANFDDATPEANYVSLPKDNSAGQGYLYASKRWHIPFGWYANTLPSLCSNAWVLMNTYSYNPFQFKGKLAGENYATPEKTDISTGDNPSQGNALPRAVKVKFTAGNLGPITDLVLSYNTNGSNNDWIEATKVQGREGFADLPMGTKAIAIAFNNKGWSGACKLNPATKICADADCKTVKTIVTRWSADGSGDCDVS